MLAVRGSYDDAFDLCMAACAEFSVLAELPDEALAPVPPAAPMASTCR